MLDNSYQTIGDDSNTYLYSHCIPSGTPEPLYSEVHFNHLKKLCEASHKF